MFVRSNVLNNGPISLLKQIATTYSIELPVNFKSQVTVFVSSGQSWSGIPVGIEQDDKHRAFIIFEVNSTKKIVMVDLDEIFAVEFENLETIYSFLEKPWTFKDPKFCSISKLQFSREVEALWSFFPELKVTFDFEKFQKSDEKNGALLAWTTGLKKEVEGLLNDPLGKKIFAGISEIFVTSGSEPITLTKNGNQLLFAVSLSKESFDQKELVQILNKNL